MTQQPRSGMDGLVEDLSLQRTAVVERAPAYDRILCDLIALLAEDGALRQRMAAALGSRTFAASYERPLLILASLRHDALLEGHAHPLHAAIADRSNPAAATRQSVAAALAHERVFTKIANRYVQTNETTRAVAWRWPAALAGCADGGRPLALVDIGASAGLNLLADALPAPWTDEANVRLPAADGAHIVLRLGLDARPLDPLDPDAAAWLRACIWPGDVARLTRLDAAIAAWEETPGTVERADISRVPARIAEALASLAPDTLLLAYQTVVRDYLPPDLARTYAAAMHDLVATSAPGRLAFIELEAADGADATRPAAITAHVRGPGGVEDLVLARCHWHPSSIAVDRAAADRFSDLATRPS